MIIGNGMIAASFINFANDANIVIFASGVSDSKTKDDSLFKREELLLKEAINQNKLLVYFSTCSIYDDSINLSKYVMHKLKMEKIIQKYCNKFYIFRLPQVAGVTNSPTLINFLFKSICNNRKITIYKNSTRNIIYIDDVNEIVSYFIKNTIAKNTIINIATPFNTSVVNIVKKIESILGIKAIYTLSNDGNVQNIDISTIKEIGVDFNIYNKTYLDDILEKYYKGMY